MKKISMMIMAACMISQLTACGKEGDVGPFGNMQGPKKPGWMQDAEKRKQQEQQQAEQAPAGAKQE